MIDFKLPRVESFSIDDCHRSIDHGRPWHIRKTGYIFPFDDRAEFTWHVGPQEKEAFEFDLPGIRSYRHSAQPNFQLQDDDGREAIGDRNQIPTFHDEHGALTH